MSRDGEFICEVTLGSCHDYRYHRRYYIFHTLENDEQYLLYKNLEDDNSSKFYATIYDDTQIDFDCECSLDDAYDRARGKSEPLMLVAIFLRNHHRHNVLLDAYNMLTAIAKFLP